MNNTASSFSPIIFLVEIVLIYGLFLFPLYVMAKKTDDDMPWLAFVPLAGLYTMVKLAGKELWWIVLMFIPCVNIVVGVILWMAIAERMGKPSWLGILTIIPVVNLAIPCYLAFG